MRSVRETRPDEVRVLEVRLGSGFAPLRSAARSSLRADQGRQSGCFSLHLFHSSTPCLRIARCSGFAMAA